MQAAATAVLNKPGFCDRVFPWSAASCGWLPTGRENDEFFSRFVVLTAWYKKMDIAIPEILNKYPVTAGFGISIALISVIIKTATGLIDFYEEFLVKRYIKRLNSLADHVKDKESITSNYVSSLQENEIFRIVSGIKASPEKANMLMKIYLLGIVSRDYLKRLSEYLTPENNKISITIHWINKFQFCYSFFAAFFFFLYGLIVALLNSISGEPIKIIAGLIVMFIFSFIGTIVGRDYATFRVLELVRKRLIDLDMVTNPNDSIQLDLMPRRFAKGGDK